MQEVSIKESTARDYTNIYYDFTYKAEDVYRNEECIKKAIAEPPLWWKNLTPFVRNCKNVESFIEKHEDEYWARPNDGLLATSKKCPAIIKHLSNSVIVKAPCDIRIRTNEDTFQWKVSNGNQIDIGCHDSDQVDGYPYHILKFNFPIVIKADQGVTASFVKPIFYDDFGFDVAPGIVDLSLLNQLNIISLFSKKQANYFIPYNSVIAILQLSKRIKSITRTDLSKEKAKYAYDMARHLDSTTQSLRPLR